MHSISQMSLRKNPRSCFDISVSVYQATHAESCKFDIDYIKSIHVGAALNPSVTYASLKDSMGVNISEKNPWYCELTALYWIWKNDITSDIIGLCHYRRIFPFRYKKSIVKKLENYDVIVPNSYGFRSSLYEEYKKFHRITDLKNLIEVIDEYSPEYSSTAYTVLTNNQLIPYNMFIAKKEIFHTFCGWLFPLLERLEDSSRLLHVSTASLGLDSKEKYQLRYIGFLAERLMTIYFTHNKYKLCHVPIINTQKPYMFLIDALSTTKNNMIFKMGEKKK